MGSSWQRQLCLVACRVYSGSRPRSDMFRRVGRQCRAVPWGLRGVSWHRLFPLVRYFLCDLGSGSAGMGRPFSGCKRRVANLGTSHSEAGTEHGVPPCYRRSSRILWIGLFLSWMARAVAVRIDSLRDPCLCPCCPLVYRCLCPFLPSFAKEFSFDGIACRESLFHDSPCVIALSTFRSLIDRRLRMMQSRAHRSRYA